MIHSESQASPPVTECCCYYWRRNRSRHREIGWSLTCVADLKEQVSQYAQSLAVTPSPAGVELDGVETRSQIALAVGSPETFIVSVQSTAIWIFLVCADGRSHQWLLQLQVLGRPATLDPGLPVVIREVSKISSISLACDLALRSIITGAFSVIAATNSRYAQQLNPPSIGSGGSVVRETVWNSAVGYLSRHRAGHFSCEQ